MSSVRLGSRHSTLSILWSLSHYARLTDMPPRLVRVAVPAGEDAAYREVARGDRGAVNLLFLPLSALRLPVTVAAKHPSSLRAKRSNLQPSTFRCADGWYKGGEVVRTAG